MKVKVTVDSDQLTVEELRQLLQAIRICEQIWFPDKEISVWVECPELSTDEASQILASIQPPYKHGPRIFTRENFRP